jgi:hypothetical protein
VTRRARYPLPAYALSECDIHRDHHAQDPYSPPDDPWPAILACFDGAAIVVPDDIETARALGAALYDVCNGLEESERMGEAPTADEARAWRAASVAFGRIAAKVMHPVWTHDAQQARNPAHLTRECAP